MRSRANEFIDGDKNSKHFHHKACSRRCRNLIKGLNDENGCWKTSKSDIERLITAYYESLFSTSSPSGFDNAVDGLGAIVTADMNDFLDTEPTTEEIRSATFQMHRTKAPGIDGFHALFYQNFRNIVGYDVVSFMKSWQRGLYDFKEVNKTCVALIPKCNEQKNIAEYRPISYFNVHYKIISKVIANKLKPVLGDVVSYNHSAFVQGRLITDNANLAFEIIYSMKRVSTVAPILLL